MTTPRFPTYHGPPLPKELNFWNPQHWLLVLQWVFFQPSRLKQYLYQADPDLYFQTGRSAWQDIATQSSYRSLWMTSVIGSVIACTLLLATFALLLDMAGYRLYWTAIVLVEALGVAVGVAVGVAYGVALGVAVSMGFGVVDGVTGGVTRGFADNLAIGVAFGVVFGVAVGVVFGVAVGMAVGVGTILGALRVPFWLIELPVALLAVALAPRRRRGGWSRRYPML